MDTPFTLNFETFWKWLLSHPNCIIRGGCRDAILYDDEDFHWQFSEEGGVLLVQVLRGKRLLGEFFLEPERVDYVQCLPGQNESEFMFELISETESEQAAAYFFVLTHAYEDQAAGSVH